MLFLCIIFIGILHINAVIATNWANVCMPINACINQKLGYEIISDTSVSNFCCFDTAQVPIVPLRVVLLFDEVGAFDSRKEMVLVDVVEGSVHEQHLDPINLLSLAWQGLERLHKFME